MRRKEEGEKGEAAGKAEKAANLQRKASYFLRGGRMCRDTEEQQERGKEKINLKSTEAEHGNILLKIASGLANGGGKEKKEEREDWGMIYVDDPTKSI